MVRTHRSIEDSAMHATARRLGIALVLAAFLAVPGANAECIGDPVSPVAPELTTATLPAWREYILPDTEESAWERIPWLASFADGLSAARRERKPLLFWGMNGHPLGCT